VSSDDVVKVQGVVTAINRGGLFEVEMQSPGLQESKTILARTSGKMRQFQIKIVVGDTVEVELSPYDLSLGRITRRNK